MPFDEAISDKIIEILDIIHLFAKSTQQRRCSRYQGDEEAWLIEKGDDDVGLLAVFVQISLNVKCISTFLARIIWLGAYVLKRWW